jgi:hypothetical protein
MIIGRSALIAIYAIALIPFAGFAIYLFAIVHTAYKVDQWTPTPAQVLSISINPITQNPQSPNLPSSGGSSKYPTYKAKLEYEYTFNETLYRSTTIEPDYFLLSSNRSGEQSVSETDVSTLRTLAPGSSVTVYVDPQSPANASFLRESFLSRPLLLFAIVWTAVPITILAECIVLLRRSLPGRAGGFRVFETPTESRVRMGTASPLTFFITTVILSVPLFVGCVLSTLAQLTDSWTLPIASGSSVLFVALTAWAIRARIIASGKCDIIINHAAKTITLPESIANVALPFAHPSHATVANTTLTSEITASPKHPSAPLSPPIFARHVPTQDRTFPISVVSDIAKQHNTKYTESTSISSTHSHHSTHYSEDDTVSLFFHALQSTTNSAANPLPAPPPIVLWKFKVADEADSFVAWFRSKIGLG